MRDAGRIAAALDVLAQFEARRVPIKVCLADWARGARYAAVSYTHLTLPTNREV